MVTYLAGKSRSFFVVAVVVVNGLPKWVSLVDKSAVDVAVSRSESWWHAKGEVRSTPKYSIDSFF